MDIMVVFQTMLKLFLLLVLGFVLFKCHIFDEYTNKKISALIVNVASPILIISSIAGVEGNNKSIVFLMIGAGILMYIGFIILLRISFLIYLSDSPSSGAIREQAIPEEEQSLPEYRTGNSFHHEEHHDGNPSKPSPLLPVTSYNQSSPSSQIPY